MNLKEYYDSLTEFINEHPEALEHQVVSSADAEGNSFDTVCYGPSLGHYSDRDFTSIDLINDEDEFDEEDRAGMPINSVCIN